ncbi:SDR family oxidoreductase [bacterium]|nr:SDR family oxidoreductase [bacterium]
MKKALITGGTGGLGKELCSAYVDAGYEVVAIDVSPFRGKPVCDFLEVNIAKMDDVEQKLSAIGVPDVIINCAGITRDRVCWKMSSDEWQTVIDVNLTGAFNVVRTLSPGMKSRRSGVIINISSINGSRGKFGQTNYTAAKAGLEALTRNWAIELGPFGIRSNAIAPGMVMTEMTRSLPEDVLERAASERRLPYPVEERDIANTALFLSSDESRCITGQTIRVDCGQLICT